MHSTITMLAGLLAAANAHILRRTDQCYALGGPSCTDLVIGQKDTGKQICTSVSGGNLIVNYPAVSGYPYSEVQVYLGSSPPASSAPGRFPYTSGNGYCKVSADKSTATCTIPISEFGTCGGSYYIATHSAQGTETGWGQGPCITKTCNPWAMYWGPITIDCPCTSSTPTVSSTSSASTPLTTSSSVSTTSSSTPSTSTSSTSSGTTPAATSQCVSSSTFAPVVTSSACPKQVTSVTQTTCVETSYTTTVITNVYTTTSDVSATITTTGTCVATTTPAPITYTTTCAAAYPGTY